MDILAGCVNRIRKEEKLINDDCYDKSVFDNLFRKNTVSFYDDMKTEAISLMEKRTHINRYSNENNKKKKQSKLLQKKEMQNINEILYNIDFETNSRKICYNVEYQNLKKKIVNSNKEPYWEKDTEIENKCLKKKYTVLKKEHNELLENIENKINLELIKAGVFYNKEDVKSIFNHVRKQQTELNTKKGVVKIQNEIIEVIVKNNKLNKKKLKISKNKIQKLVQMCKFYYNQNIFAKNNLKKIKNVFLEYKLALENVVYCCEQIGGDKIILMDAVKTAKAQKDLHTATNFLNLKKMDELKIKMEFCEHKINNLENKLKDQMKKLSDESNEKKQIQIQVQYFKNELIKNNDVLEEVYETFRNILSELDIVLKELDGKTDIKTLSNEMGTTYVALLKKLSDLLVINLKNVEGIISPSKYERSPLDPTELQHKLEKDKLEKEKEEEAERRGIEEEEEEAERKRIAEEEEEMERKRIEKETEIEKKRLEEEEKERMEGQLLEEKNEQFMEEDILSFDDQIMQKLKKIIEEMKVDKFTYNECIDIIYKLNLPLTEEKITELKTKNELTQEELSSFAKSLIQNEEEVLQNMITFFEIWDVKKSRYINKELFILIMKQFGDQFTEEETAFLQNEMVMTSGPNVCYVDILKKWICENQIPSQ